MGQPYSTVLISPPIIRLSSLSRSFSHSLTGSVPEAVLKNLAGRIFSESFIRMLYHIWYNMSSSMLHMNITIELYWLLGHPFSENVKFFGRMSQVASTGGGMLSRRFWVWRGLTLPGVQSQGCTIPLYLHGRHLLWISLQFSE